MTPDLAKLEAAHALAQVFRVLAVAGSIAFVLYVIRCFWKETH